jgi:hypothetical protein
LVIGVQLASGAQPQPSAQAIDEKRGGPPRLDGLVAFIEKAQVARQLFVGEVLVRQKGEIGSEGKCPRNLLVVPIKGHSDSFDAPDVGLWFARELHFDVNNYNITVLVRACFDEVCERHRSSQRRDQGTGLLRPEACWLDRNARRVKERGRHGQPALGGCDDPTAMPIEGRPLSIAGPSPSMMMTSGRGRDTRGYSIVTRKSSDESPFRACL